MTGVYTHGNFEKALDAQRPVHGAVAVSETRVGGHPVIFVGLTSGWDFAGKKTTATRKWLCSKQMSMVGATGFEPVTSTV